MIALVLHFLSVRMKKLLRRKLCRGGAEPPAQQPQQNCPGTGLLIVGIQRARDINGRKLLQTADQVAVLKFGGGDRPQERLTKVQKRRDPVWDENIMFINTYQCEEDIALHIVLQSHYRWWGDKTVGEIRFTTILGDLLRLQGSGLASIPARPYPVLYEGKHAGDIIVSFTFIRMPVENLADGGGLISAPPSYGHGLRDRRDDDTGNYLTNLTLYLTPAVNLISALAALISGLIA